MADSFEQQIADHGVELLQTILVTNGYQTDIGTTVEDSRPNWPDEELPAVSLFLGSADVEKNHDNLTKCVRLVPMMIRIAWQRKDTAAEDAAYGRKAIQDVHACMGTDPLFDGLIMKLRPAGHGLEMAPDTHEITGAQVQFEVAYLAQKFDLTQR